MGKLFRPTEYQKKVLLKARSTRSLGLSFLGTINNTPSPFELTRSLRTTRLFTNPNPCTRKSVLLNENIIEIHVKRNKKRIPSIHIEFANIIYVNKIFEFNSHMKYIVYKPKSKSVL